MRSLKTAMNIREGMGRDERSE